MTNAVTLFGGMKLPAQITQRGLSPTTMALLNRAPQGKRISIEGGVFRLVAGGKEIAKNKNRDMNIIVVRSAPTENRVYYDPSIKYQRGQAVPPTCSSADGVTPDSRITSPQAKTCATCPQNVAGSGNGNSRACRYQRRLAVVLDGDMEGDVYQLALSATSTFGKGNGGIHNLPFGAYVEMLAYNGISVDNVVTKMEFDTDAATPKLTFSPVRPLEGAEFDIVARQGDSLDALFAVGDPPEHFAQAAQPAPSAKNTAPAFVAVEDNSEETDEAEEDEAPIPPPKKTKPAPVVEDDDEEVEAPVKVTKPAPSRESQIANVLEAWG